MWTRHATAVQRCSALRAAERERQIEADIINDDEPCFMCSSAWTKYRICGYDLFQTGHVPRSRSAFAVAFVANVANETTGKLRSVATGTTSTICAPVGSKRLSMHARISSSWIFSARTLASIPPMCDSDACRWLHSIDSFALCWWGIPCCVRRRTRRRSCARYHGHNTSLLIQGYLCV